MLDWGFLIDQSALASVIPDEYARFRRPISGALAVFLEGLSPERQQTILADQASLSATATAAERLAVLARGCPALHKLGQVLARDRRLSAEVRTHLQGLESLAPSVPLAAIEDILSREFGPLDRRGVTLEPPALAEASVAVVIPFRDDRGTARVLPRHGVFKLLKPGVVERLEAELELFERVGAFLDQRCDEFEIPHLDYRESFELVRDKLRHEVRFDREQQYLAQARSAYADDARVLVPALFDLCTRQVTAMERVTGTKVTEHALPERWDRSRLARLVIESLIARPFFARSGATLFHGDPHPGNLFVTRDGRLAILDWSLAGALGERQRTALVQALLGALTLDGERIATALADLAVRPVDRPALASAVHVALGQVLRGQFPSFTWLLDLLDAATQTARLRVGADLMVFRKALHTLDGVVTEIGVEGACVDAVVVGEFLRHLLAEWPWRWLAPPGSRAFATRLSNADLTGFLVSLPFAVTRFWLEALRIRPQLQLGGTPLGDRYESVRSHPTTIAG
jgi:ubiquinone biosynthesis protein